MLRVACARRPGLLVRNTSSVDQEAEVVRARTKLTTQHAIQFKPCIDIHKGKVKQIVGSSLNDISLNRSNYGSTLITNFESTFPASFYAELYKESKLTGGHVIMLGDDEASRQAAYLALMRYPGGLQLGGGVTLENAERYLEAGASHVIVTSYVFRDGHLDDRRLQKLLDVVGRERLVLDLSCRKKGDSYYVVTDRWQKFSDLKLNVDNINFLEGCCNEFLVHGVDVEGKRLGIDEELVNLLGRLVKIPVTYAGGASTLEDLERVKAAGDGKVDITVGSALDIFGGNLPFQAVLDWHNLQKL